MNRTHKLLAAGLVGVIFSLILVSAGVATAGNIIAIDDNHDIATDSAAEQYDENGSVSTEVDRLQMDIEVHQRAEDAGIDRFGPDFDVTTHYLCVDYQEDIDRTVRFEIPDDYWHPHPQHDLESVDGDTTMDMTPDNDLNNSVITIDFTGETQACFEIDRTTAGYFQIREGAHQRVEEETGISLPSLSGSSEQWEYVDPQLLESEDTVPIDAPYDELTLQYDELEDDPGDRRWIAVPDCSQSRASDAPVCSIDQETDEGDNYSLLVIQDSDPPDVRYKHGTDYMSQIRSAVFDDLGGVFDRAAAQYNSLKESLFGS